MQRCLLAAVVVLSAFASVAAPQDKKAPDAIVDPEKAGVAFTVQGEYEGVIGTAKHGLQIIALPGSKFDAFLLDGGLPGAGWDGKTRVKLTAIIDEKQASPTKVSFTGGEWKGQVFVGKPSRFVGTAPKGETFTLKQVIRESTTAGKKSPPDAVILFDGSSADAWNAGKLVDDKLLGPGATTKKMFGDFTLHVEFRLPFRPTATGQKRATAAFISSSATRFRFSTASASNRRRTIVPAIYEQTPPSVNMCYPPLSWQTYDIDFTAARFDNAGKKTANARVTVIHNGVKVHDNAEIKGPTGHGKKEENTPGAINLQYHNNPVYFRNIWLVEKK